MRPERLDRTVKLTGLEYIDVPALGKKDYRLNFYAHKEGSFVAKVSTLTCTPHTDNLKQTCTLSTLPSLPSTSLSHR